MRAAVVLAGHQQAVPVDGNRLRQAVADAYRQRPVAHADRRAEVALVIAGGERRLAAEEVAETLLGDELQAAAGARVEERWQGKALLRLLRRHRHAHGSRQVAGKRRRAGSRSGQELTPVHAVTSK